MTPALIDTGPLVALFNGRDRQHARCVAWLKANATRYQFISNVAVLVECTHLLHFHGQAQADFLGWAEQALEIEQTSAVDRQRIREVVIDYGDLPADFTDASLIALAERRAIGHILSLDSDFDALRRKDGLVLGNLLRQV